MAEQQVRIETALADESFRNLIVDAVLPNGQVIRGAVMPMTLDRQQVAAALIQYGARLRAMPQLTGIVPVEAQEYDRLNAAHTVALTATPDADVTPTPDATPTPVAETATETPDAPASAKKASK